MRLEPPPYALHVQRAEALSDLGRPEEALDEARKALALDAAEAEAWLGMARALLALDRLDEALEAAEAGLQRDAASPWGHLLRSAILSSQGAHQEAFEAAQRAMQLVPGHPAVHRRRAWCFLALDRPADALRDARRATRRAPDDPDNHVIVARIGLLYGERGAALEAAEEAARLAPDEAPVLATLGDALAATEQAGPAIDAFVRAVRADPRLPYAKARLVERVELGPLAVAQGVGSVVRLFALVGALLLLRLLLGGGSPQDLVCIVGVFLGLFLPGLLVRQSGRLRLEELSPGAWEVYRQARRELDARRPLAARVLAWADPRR